ncbi:N-acetylmuramidase domain-containing protein [Persicobacter diffluens]|uniref:N-acetylmuramoyl-L-alanine amidase n=1 Tax=Persicobacter diffluens TaxID=981 RepID=A0AAN4W4R2_9BACT|nr:hypothetical protein PEDI_52030 [Persicobacter diffluens]
MKPFKFISGDTIEGGKNLYDKRSDYSNFFFRSIRRATNILFFTGLLGAILIYLHHQEVYKVIAIIFLLVWLVVFLKYFLWAIYHYNINYGLTAQDWREIKEARLRKNQGFPVKEEDTQGPSHNPYRSQTFGLPPGTVRGMIAFTLLFGAITILIASMGMTKTHLENSLIRDQFEFFKTAFLMMIAFYFGDKSLRYLQKRWTTPNQSNSSTETEEQNRGEQTINTANQLAIEDIDYQQDELQFAQEEDGIKVEEKQKVGLVKAALNQNFSLKHVERINDIPTGLRTQYPQVDNIMNEKIISEEHLKKAIADLKKDHGVILMLPVLKAIIEVESGGRGHLNDGRTKILFEGHKFWKWLKRSGKEPELYLTQETKNILYNKWTKQYYKGGAGEYSRLAKAKEIDKKAAIYSTSWGLFQILGENLEQNIKSRLSTAENQSEDFYTDLDDFVAKQDKSEYYHLLDFLAFILNKKVSGKRLIDYVSGYNPQEINWRKFAYGYNGAGYEANNYHIKLEGAFQKYSSSFQKERNAVTVNIPIIDCGHGGFEGDKYTTGEAKRYKFTGSNQEGLEIFEGEINRKIALKLISKLKEANLRYYDLNSNDPKDLPLKERVKIADELYDNNKSYYFLSIHSNSASKSIKGQGTTANGFEIFTSRGTTTSDAYAQIAAEKYREHFPRKKFRGVKESDFYVLKYTDCPAILVENLFFDNFEEAKFLISDEGQEKIASCLFDIIKKLA